jgi:hypothetical protein
MASLICTANGNLTAAATWAIADATSLMESEANSTNLTTSYVESQTFTPGAITIDAIAVKVQARVASTGTFSVRLAQAGATVAGTEVTINVTDLVSLGNTTGSNGWILFKFAAPVLLVAATLYTVSAKTSSATQVGLFRNATAGNWSRMLRTTTTAAPGAGDRMFIIAEWTAAATKTNRSVTMDSTAATDYGDASTTLASLGIGNGGTLAYGTTAATNYILRLSGLLDIWAGGTFTIGTDPSAAGTAIPRDSTAVLEFDCAADGDFGYRTWSPAFNFQAHGLSRTIAKDVVQCLLNTDEAAAQTVLGVDTDTGFLNGDTIAIAATTRTGTEAETATLNGAAGASSITISAGLGAAHGGSAANQVQAEVILLTRNVMIRSVTSTFGAYGLHQGRDSNNAGGTVNWSWVDFRYLGSGTGTKSSVLHCVGLPATITARFCAFRDGEGRAISTDANALAGDGTLTLTDCVFYNIGLTSSHYCVGVGSMTAATLTATLTRCTCIWDSTTSNNYPFFRTDDETSPFTLDGCRVSSGTGLVLFINYTATAISNYTVVRRLINGNFHCCGSGAGGNAAVSINAPVHGLLIDNCVFWRNVATVGAIGLNNRNTEDLLISDCTFFGNSTLHVSLTDSGHFSVTFRNCSFSGDSTFSTTSFFDTSQGGIGLDWRFENCTFGVATGIRVAHTGATFSGTAVVTSGWYYELTLVNCNLADATEFDTDFLARADGSSFIARQRKDGTTNTHEKLYPRKGTVAYDATTFRTAAPSEKLTPTIGTGGVVRLRSSPKRIPVTISKAVTVSAYTRKDATYNGGEPRLVMLANPALGLDDDLVLDTMTVAHSNWEQLTGTQTPVAEEDGVVEVVVEVDGSAGNVYVDDWSASSA